MINKANDKTDQSFLHGELLRVTDWVKFSDAKAGFLSAAYLGLLGIFFTQSESLQITWCWCSTFALVVIAFIASYAFGICSLIMTVFPRLRNDSGIKSNFYFSHVAKMAFGKFSQSVKDMTGEEVDAALLEQIHINSKIASIKMKGVQISSVLLGISILLASILFLL